MQQAVKNGDDTLDEFSLPYSCMNQQIHYSMLFSPGAVPRSLLVRPEGPVEEPAAGGPDQAVRQPEERRQ